MAPAIDEFATHNFDDFINGIGKLKASILDVDRCLGVGTVAAVDVDDTAHVPLLMPSGPRRRADRTIRRVRGVCGAKHSALVV